MGRSARITLSGEVSLNECSRFTKIRYKSMCQEESVI